jgi:hypothetical protein
MDPAEIEPEASCSSPHRYLGIFQPDGMDRGVEDSYVEVVPSAAPPAAGLGYRVCLEI